MKNFSIQSITINQLIMGTCLGNLTTIQKDNSISQTRKTNPMTNQNSRLAAYYILYFAKTFFYTGLLKQGLPAPGAWLLVIEKVPASVFNAAVALIAAPPITLIILQALKRSHLDRLLEE